MVAMEKLVGYFFIRKTFRNFNKYFMLPTGNTKFFNFFGIYF